MVMSRLAIMMLTSLCGLPFSVRRLAIGFRTKLVTCGGGLEEHMSQFSSSSRDHAAAVHRTAVMWHGWRPVIEVAACRMAASGGKTPRFFG
jgi:hypothetical protein